MVKRYDGKLGHVEDGNYVSYKEYAALQQKLDAMAAEADYLRNAIREHSESTHFCEVCGKDDPCETDHVCLALKYELPATETYLNSVRAEGIELVKAKTAQAKERLSELDNYEDYEPYLLGLDDACDQVIEEILTGKLPENFSVQIRSGTHDTADKAG